MIICEKSHNRIKSEALIHHDTTLDGDIIERLRITFFTVNGSLPADVLWGSYVMHS